MEYFHLISVAFCHNAMVIILQLLGVLYGSEMYNKSLAGIELISITFGSLSDQLGYTGFMTRCCSNNSSFLLQLLLEAIEIR